MQRVFMSVLGTTDYFACNYVHQGQRVENVRFVQEATARMFCGNWNSEDRIVVFTTKKSEASNWRNNGHIDRNGAPLDRKGLGDCLQDIDLQCSLENIRIPEGRSQEEIWALFSIIEKQIPHDGEVTFDITHSFRFLPMLALTALNFAKATKNISIGGLYYGALEALGGLPEVKAMPQTQRDVPIFDLTAFDQLAEWAVAVDRFVSSGDARQIGRLAEKSVRPILAETLGQDQAARSVKTLGKSLAEFADAAATCRGPQFKEIGQRLKTNFAEYRPTEHAAAFDPLYRMVRDPMSRFNGEDVNDGIQTAEWCLNHGLIQQGFTILLETAVTAVLHFVHADPNNLKARSSVTGAVHAIEKGHAERDPKLQDTVSQKIVAFLEKRIDLVKSLRRIVALRNDFNHAGWGKNQTKPETFKKSLEEGLSVLREKLPYH